MDVHDLHATMLHLMGIDHEKLTYQFQGRDFRLTDVSGKVVTKLPCMSLAAGFWPSSISAAQSHPAPDEPRSYSLYKVMLCRYAEGDFDARRRRRRRASAPTTWRRRSEEAWRKADA